MGEWLSWLLQNSWLLMGAKDVRENMLRFCGTIGTLTSGVWVRSAVRWVAGCPSRKLLLNNGRGELWHSWRLVASGWRLVAIVWLALLMHVRVLGVVQCLSGCGDRVAD